MSDSAIVAKKSDGSELLEATAPPVQYDLGTGRVLVTGNEEVCGAMLCSHMCVCPPSPPPPPVSRPTSSRAHRNVAACLSSWALLHVEDEVAFLLAAL